MRRVRQESAEIYEVTTTEIALALGLLLCEEDAVTLEYKYADKYRVTVKAGENESVEIEVPMPVPIGADGVQEALAELATRLQPMVVIPPFDQFGPGSVSPLVGESGDFGPLSPEVEAV